MCLWYPCMCDILEGLSFLEVIPKYIKFSRQYRPTCVCTNVVSSHGYYSVHVLVFTHMYVYTYSMIVTF